jgi:hypothetical protein
MAVTENFYTGNGSTTSFSLTFEYLEEDDVKVTLNEVITTAYSFANATTILFNTAPANGVAIRIYRDTDVDDLKSTFFAGSSIRAQDLNNNFLQNNFAVQEIKNYTWDNETQTIHSDEAWVSSDTQIATTAAMDARFQDEATETIESTETWVSDDDRVPTTLASDNRVDSKIDAAITGDIGTDGTGITVTDDGDGTITLGLGSGSIDLDRIKNADIVTSAEANPNNDTTIATTAKIDDMIDAAITGDIAVDSTGLTLTNDGDGTITLGIGSSSVDLDRIKAGDIITQSEQDSGTTETDSNIFTALAAAKRFDTLVQTSNPGLVGNWEVGKTWLQNDSNRALSIWNGSSWLTVSEGGGFVSQPNVVYVDKAAGDDAATGNRISTPKETIKAAIEQINSNIEIDVTAVGFNGGSGYVNGNYSNVSLTHSSGTGIGTGLQATITVSGGAVTAISLSAAQQTTLEEYSIGDVLTASNADLGGSGSGLLIPITGEGDGQIVVVAAGVYQEIAPIQIKRRNVSIIGQALRSCIVHPTQATETNNLFELNSGSYLSSMTFTGIKAGTGTGNTLDATLPTTQGWNAAFYSGAFITKSPYIQNCTNFSDSEIDNSDLRAHRPRGGAAGDTDSAPTGGGLLVNGATVDSSSPLRSMVCDSYTHVALNGPGVLVVNNGYAQITSSYAFFNKYHIKCLSGGQANLAASTTDFGDQALVADGRSTNAIFTTTTIANAADQATEFFIEGPTARTATPLPWHGTSTRPQSNMLVDIGGNIYPILSSSNTFDADEIISGRDYTILTVGDTDFTAIGAASNTVGVQFTATGVGSGSGTVTDDTGWRVTISRPDPANRNNNLGLDGAVTSGGAVSFFLRSQVASSGHTMEYVGSGTNYSALPENGGVPDESRQITESNNGKVWTAITDHNGKFKIGGNQTTDPIFEVDQQTGFITIPEGSIAFNLLSDATPQLGGNLDVNGNTITGLSNPTANDEVANKAYVDAVAGTPTQIAQLNTSVVTSDTGTDGTITFTTNGTTAMTVDASGRLLVGTSTVIANKSHLNGAINPQFEIDGTGIPNATLAITNWNSAAASPSHVVLSKSKSGTVGTRTLVANNDDIGAVVFTADDGTAFIPAASILAEVDGTPGANDMPGRLVFATTADGASAPTERLRITSAGNVGIGTGAPAEILALRSSSSAIQIDTNRSNTTYGNAEILLGSPRSDTADGSTVSGRGLLSCLGSSTSTTGIVWLQAATASLATQLTDTALKTKQCGIRLASDGSFEHWGSGSQRLKIDSSGRLLVGTSTSVTSSVSQQSLLQVYSTSSSASSIQIGNYTAGVNAAGLHFDKSRGTTVGTNTVLQSGDNIGSIKFNGADGTNLVRAAAIDCAVDGTPGTNDMPGRLVFSTTADGASSPTERMRIDANGNVEIRANSNTVSTGASLYLFDTVGAAQGGNSSGRICFYSSDATDGPSIRSEISNRYENTSADSALVFKTYNGTLAERLRIANTGALGLSGANYGTSGQVLTSNGSASAPTWGDRAIATAVQDTSAGTETEFFFTNIPTWAKVIIINFHEVRVNVTNDINVQLGSNGTYYSSAYLSVSINAAGTAGANSTTEFVIDSAGSTSFISGQMILTCLRRRTAAQVGYWSQSHELMQASTGTGTRNGGGHFANATTNGDINCIRISAETSTTEFNSGRISLTYF